MQAPCRGRAEEAYRCGGSGTLTPLQVCNKPCQFTSRYEVKPDTNTGASCVSGVIFVLGSLGALILVSSGSDCSDPHPEQPHSGTKVAGGQERCKRRKRQCREPQGPDRLWPCLSVIVGGAVVSLFQVAGTTDVWVTHQAASIGLLSSWALLSSAVCVLLRAIIGKQVRWKCSGKQPKADTATRIIHGFGNSFSVTCSPEKPKPRRLPLRMGPLARAWRLLLILFGFSYAPQVFAMQDAPAVRCPLAVISLFMPDAVQAMTAPERLDAPPRTSAAT